jgi:hypothetical protein
VSRELVAYVHVAGRVFAPGDDVPDEYAKKITNPVAWKGEVPAEDGPPSEPPRAGKGSGRDAWVAFASSRGVAVPESMTRDDIIAGLVSQGIIAPGE